MSVIMNSKLGDKIVVIEEFSSSPHKQDFSWKTAKTFKIGDKVKFCSFIHSNKMPLILFENHEGELYTGFATCFTTKEQFNLIGKYFQKMEKLK